MPVTSRRRWLRAAGVSIALPSFVSECSRAQSAESAAPPIRMVCIGNEFGMYPGAFWPEVNRQGDQIESVRFGELLQPLESMRERLTVFAHLDHGLKGGHFAVHTFLTGVKASEAKNMPDAGISLDQRAAEFVSSRTRFPSLTIGSEGGLHGGCRMSWTRTGTRVPPIEGPRELFERLFIQGDQKAKQATLAKLNLQESILDTVLGDARSLSGKLNHSDRQKLDEYLASIRDVETRLQLDRTWQNVPKPTPTVDRPNNEGLTKDLPKLYDLIALALQTDSTRIATLEVGGSFAASDLGIRQGYHALSHHGQRPESIELLVQIERYQVEQFARFLERLDSTEQSGTDRSLLDQTITLFGSGMGNANSHTNHDLPVILVGGGFRHRTYVQQPAEKNRRVPLCNLYVSMLQRFGVETDHFANSTGTLSGLEVA